MPYFFFSILGNNLLQPDEIEMEEDSTFQIDKKDSSTMTDLSMEDIENLEKEKEGFKPLTKILQELAKKSLTSDILNNPKILDFYSKLPSTV